LPDQEKDTTLILQFFLFNCEVVLLSFSKVMGYYPFYYIPLTLPSPPTTGERGGGLM